ncbi:MAG TPA: 1-deoxy-D-xylulose-5-phosphate synthase, partial [Burkholderiaceae bacterium]|nr:1-deoxy-D-xylulose-5-phosphate synthase [Burkholderiaceae bacterium]
LKTLKDLKGPQLLHIITTKGKGYAPAEREQIEYHAVGPFDPVKGLAKKGPGKITYTEVFGNWLCEMAAEDSRLYGITPAMREGSGLVRFSKEFPQRYFDVGIAEQHAVTFAAGLACEGLKPVVAIYSTFLQRAYDQLIHDVAIQNLPVVFALDRAGLVGADGATHAGNYDIAYLRCIPNMSVLTPADERECRAALTTAFRQDHPVSVRYPRGAGAGVAAGTDLPELPFGKGEMRRTIARAAAQGGPRVAILAFGTLLYPALAAAERVDATVANMRFVKPLDVELVTELAGSHDAIVTVEDGCVAGGAGSAVQEALASAGIQIPVLALGLPDAFIEHGDPAQLMAMCGLDAAGIEQAILKRFGARPALVRSA